MKRSQTVWRIPAVVISLRVTTSTTTLYYKWKNKSNGFDFFSSPSLFSWSLLKSYKDSGCVEHTENSHSNIKTFPTNFQVYFCDIKK